MLAPWQWAILVAVPPAILALYFLRLKRQPLEVPSTYLWLKSIEDLHVNSLWQRLRQSLLLLLQLLLIALVMFALLRPTWRSTALTGGRYIFLVDASASMAARDSQPTRLDEAKRRVEGMIERMQPGDKAMLISFSDRARVEQPYTDNRKELRRRLYEIKQTDRPTSIVEAVKIASGLANPGRSADPGNVSDELVAEALPAKLFIVSDGKFADVQNFQLGNLDPTFIPIGDPGAKNLAIAAFTTRGDDDDPTNQQAFARIENFSDEPRAVSLELLYNGELIDAADVQVPAKESAGAAFDLQNVETGILEVRAATDDALPLDDRAWTVISAPRLAQVLLVAKTPNEPLAYALTTESAKRLANVTIETADYLTTDAYQKSAADGAYDLIVYDRCSPPKIPQANTFFIGAMPPAPAEWKADPAQDVPQIVDTDRAHPLMQFVEMGDVIVSRGAPLKPPPGSAVLIHSGAGPLFAIAPRGPFEDAVLGFELYSQDHIETNWPVRTSFPVFVLNVLDYLGGQAQGRLDQANVPPGQPANIRVDSRSEFLTILGPAGSKSRVPRNAAGTFSYAGTEQLGVYDVQDAGKTVDRFAVNMFNPAESDIRPRPQNAIKLGHVEVVGKPETEPARREAWKWIVVVALGVLLAEWYIYNRRVYL